MLASNLKSEIVAMAKEILENQDQLDIHSVCDKVQKLYEKSLILKYVEENSLEHQTLEEKDSIVLKFEKLASDFMATKKNVPESNPHQDDLITPGMITIKDMVDQMGDQVVSETIEQVSTMTLNDRLSKGLKLGLNDRLAFTKHLFEGRNEDLEKVLNTLASIESEEKALEFIYSYVKPEYNNWEGKEEYEDRFLSLISAQYS